MGLAVAPGAGGCRSPQPEGGAGAPQPPARIGSIGTQRGSTGLAGKTPELPATPGSPQAALADFWGQVGRKDWVGAHSLTTAAARKMVSKADLKSMAAQGPPTQKSGAAWTALFPGSTDTAPRITESVSRGETSQVRIESTRGSAEVTLRREKDKWKIDLLTTMNAAGER